MNQTRPRRHSAWWRWYDEYLRSQSWQHKRRLVLLRAGGICEGCGQEPASEAHHLTYARVGKEMLFDLVAVCSRCHQQITADERAAPKK